MKFDTRQAKLLPVGQHMLIEGCPGLRLEHTPAGRHFVYRYRLGDSLRRMKVGTWPATSIAAAVVEYERLRDIRAAGRSPADERRQERRTQPAPASITVGDIIDRYIAASSRRPKGMAELRSVLRLAEPIRAATPREITRSVAYDLVMAHAATPVQAKNLRREVGAAWDLAHDSGRLPDDVPNWWRQVARGKLRSKGVLVRGRRRVAKRRLSDEEVGEILRFLPGISRLNADLVTLYLYTGTRGAEIVAMRGDEVVERGEVLWWVIPRHKTKMARHPSAMDMPVPLLGPAAEVVRRRVALYGHGQLFPPTSGERPHVDQKVLGVCIWFHRPDNETRPEVIRARWRIPDFGAHDLRRAVRTKLTALGCPRDVAESIIGHLRPGVEGLYDLHDGAAERLRWLSLVAALWEEAAGRSPASPPLPPPAP